MEIQNVEADKYGVHEGIDLGLLNSEEMCHELAARVFRMIDSETNLQAYVRINGENDSEEFEKLTIEHDEDFCLVRECLRTIKEDDELLAC